MVAAAVHEAHVVDQKLPAAAGEVVEHAVEGDDAQLLERAEVHGARRGARGVRGPPPLRRVAPREDIDEVPVPRRRRSASQLADVRLAGHGAVERGEPRARMRGLVRPHGRLEVRAHEAEHEAAPEERLHGDARGARRAARRPLHRGQEGEGVEEDLLRQRVDVEARPPLRRLRRGLRPPERRAHGALFLWGCGQRLGPVLPGLPKIAPSRTGLPKAHSSSVGLPSPATTPS